MNWQDMMIDGYERILGALEHVLLGLNNDDLNWQPRPECNSIGWLAWHLTRVEDRNIARIMGGEQVYIRDKWYAGFERPADPDDRGGGHTPEQVKEFKSPDIQTFLDYNKAVLEQTKRYFLSLSESDLERELDEPWRPPPPPKLGWRIISVLEDCLQHTGQMAYIRGLRQGRGWQKY